ncbi:MAG: hypothetical protein IAE67_07555 [Candidatus Competibacteraceae bacterium]|nr:hypothetical protein [Candidatus Competibacteraceae bacterium]
MKFFIKILLTAAMVLAAQYYIPWYVIMMVPFILSIFIKTNGASSFFSAFIAVFLLWIIQAYLIHADSGDILTSRMAHVLPLGGNANILLLVTGAIGGLSAGIGGLTGNAFRNILISPTKNKKRKTGYVPLNQRYR